MYRPNDFIVEYDFLQTKDQVISYNYRNKI